MRRNIPHARTQLNEAAIAKGSADDDVGLGDVGGPHVDAAQHESGQRESAEAQRRRVGELAVLDRVATGLGLTTEGRQGSLGRVDSRQRTVAKARSRLGHVLGRHLGSHVGAVGGGLRGVVGDVLLEGRVLSRHCRERVTESGR